MKKWLLYSFFWYFVTFNASAQDEYPHRLATDLNQLVQELFAVQSEGISEDVIENLAQLFQNPLDINTLTYEQLTATYILSEKQLNSFFRYRAEAGSFVSIYELQAIPDFDLPTIYRLLPFVILRPDKLTMNLLKSTFNSEGKSYALFRADQTLEERKGFTPPDSRSKTRYEGSPQRYFMRYRYAHLQNFSVGFTAEKDAGEPLAWQPATTRYFADFFSFHAQIQNKGRWKNITIGDFQVQTGQGLALAGGFYIGKGSETVLTARRSNLGIRPYTSSVEGGFFRGIASTYQLTNTLDITTFYARNNRDANIVNPNTSKEEAVFSSLQTSGLHRTTSEIADKAALLEQNTGLNILYHQANNRLQVGFTALNSVFDKAYQKANSAYNRYEFSGTQNLLLSIYYSYLCQNYNFFGETARSTSGGVGGVWGILASLSKRWDGAFSVRHFDRDFHSFYANGFGENSRNINEQGVYIGAKYTPNRQWQASAYFDIFRFPEIKYLVSRPSSGYGTLIRLRHNPNRASQVFIQFFYERKEKDLPERLSSTNETTPYTRQSITLGSDLGFGFNRSLSIAPRLVYNSYIYDGFTASNGMSIMCDANVKLGKLIATGRVAYFNTDDYDSRVYAYENDVYGAFSFPAYYYKGFRYFLMIQYRITKQLDAWLRISRTDYANQDTVGSGLDEIAASHKTDARIQLRYRW